ncbi:hypothetical protein K443DRAFT_681885 [Laccaria amethystina LaAM-08-1]|uniref:alpha-1,6-mannosyl-glycoprotein 6-beta-N-acetylglucosaminyltransferase n=1 Tax=Laccaria amethystina LaAM-08-1 TaxID=1095629 RepID=A0A0C9X6R1_9AGAR|nr:hypothetical protein K443DRAFT_681885 [Laccaria amethystina LaAM-08-1]
MSSRNTLWVRILIVIVSTAFLATLFHQARFGNWKSVTNNFKNNSAPLPTTSTERYRESPPSLETHFVPPDLERKDYQEWNARTLRDLHSCIALDNCGPNQRKVALLAAHWFQQAVVQGFRGGEGIWGISVYKNLRKLGYTTLFATSFEEALFQYRMFPDLVKVVIRNKAGECHKDPQCVKGPSNPTGIPAWKIFGFEFFPSHGHHIGASLMKGKWILSANPDDLYHGEAPSPIQYLGYSIEEACISIPVIPLSERADQVWMLMKQINYVYNDDFAWNRSYFSLAFQELGTKFVGGWEMYQHYNWDPEKQGEMANIEDKEHGVINHGILPRPEFIHQVGKSKMMIGVGSPWWSPSPYDALCQGVPFLNPIRSYDHSDPWNKTKWYYSQHPSLARYDPPYVYNVHNRDYAGFVNAVKEASTTEIGRFIPDHMTETAVQDRLVFLMETDWKAQAEALLVERLKEGGDAYVFEI